MSNYFRVAGYKPDDDFCFIIDSNGMFEKKWQLSALLVSKGLKILNITTEEDMLDVNIEKVEPDTEHIFLRASKFGKPENIDYKLNDKIYKALQVGDKIYIPNKNN